MSWSCLQDAWLSWAAKVLPTDSPPIQREECYRAFMSGAAAAACLVENGSNIQPETDAFFARCSHTRAWGRTEPSVSGGNA